MFRHSSRRRRDLGAMDWTLLMHKKAHGLRIEKKTPAYDRNLNAWNTRHDPVKEKILSIDASALKAILGEKNFEKISELGRIAATGAAPSDDDTAMA
jgi:hypothetical protein